MSFVLSNFMSKANLTQAQLANELGVHKSLVGHWLQGTRRPSLAMAARLEVHTQGAIRTTVWGHPPLSSLPDGSIHMLAYMIRHKLSAERLALKLGIARGLCLRLVRGAAHNPADSTLDALHKVIPQIAAASDFWSKGGAHV